MTGSAEWGPPVGETVGEESKDPAELLLQAVDALQPRDRDAVLIWLLRGSLRGPGQQPIGSFRRIMAASQFGREPEYLASYMTGGRPSQRAQQVVPVRFPSEQHGQLRDWCAEHGFSMATVIRGLVTRFLETQQSERN